MIIRDTITDPLEFISLDSIKEHLRVTHSEEDALIEQMLGAALRHVEAYCPVWFGESDGTLLLNKVREVEYIRLYGVSSIDSVEYYQGGQWNTLGASLYDVAPEYTPAQIAFSRTVPVTDKAIGGIKIHFTAGYEPNAVPANLLHAVRIVTGIMYEQRQPEVIGTVIARSELTMERLCSPFRIINA